VISRAGVAGVAAAILACATACDTSVTPNVAVHMTSGSVTAECTQIARYNVESGRKLIKADSAGAPTHHDLLVSLAVIKQAADQFSADDPVRIGALNYVAHGTTYPYFLPCRRIMNLADTGRLPVPG
jgi:hypothetical protein